MSSSCCQPETHFPKSRPRQLTNSTALHLWPFRSSRQSRPEPSPWRTHPNASLQQSAALAAKAVAATSLAAAEVILLFRATMTTKLNPLGVSQHMSSLVSTMDVNSIVFFFHQGCDGLPAVNELNINWKCVMTSGNNINKHAMYDQELTRGSQVSLQTWRGRVSVIADSNTRELTCQTVNCWSIKFLIRLPETSKSKHSREREFFILLCWIYVRIAFVSFFFLAFPACGRLVASR